MTREEKQIRQVQRRLLASAYGEAFPMLINVTKLSAEILLDALELCERENDPAARVLQLHRDWAGAGNMTALGYMKFVDYVRWRCSPEMMEP